MTVIRAGGTAPSFDAAVGWTYSMQEITDEINRTLRRKKMPVHGDAKQSDIDDQIKETLAAGIASSSESNPVRLTTAEATRLLDMVGGPPKPKAADKPQAQQTAAHDEDDDEPPKATSRRK